MACPNLFCLLVQKIVHDQLMVILEEKSIWGTQNSKCRAFLLVRLLANQWVENPPLCTLLTLEQNVQKANKLLHCICTPTQLPLSLQNSSFQPSDTLQWKGRKKNVFFCCSYTPPSLPPSLSRSLPSPLSVRERQRNFIEKMEGTGKTRVPGGVLQGFMLHQRLPFSAGRWTHNGKMSVATVTRTSHWPGFGSGWGEGVEG